MLCRNRLPLHRLSLCFLLFLFAMQCTKKGRSEGSPGRHKDCVVVQFFNSPSCSCTLPKRRLNVSTEHQTCRLCVQPSSVWRTNEPPQSGILRSQWGVLRGRFHLFVSVGVFSFRWAAAPFSGASGPSHREQRTKKLS